MSLFPSGAATFHDIVAITGAKSFTLWDYFDRINAVVLFTTDGDHCGDYDIVNYTFKNTGLPAGGTQTVGSVSLVQ